MYRKQEKHLEEFEKWKSAASVLIHHIKNSMAKLEAGKIEDSAL
jgi:hypothetical protein